MLQFEVTFPKL